MNTTMAALARRKDPRLVRLAALRTYQKLRPPAQQFVKDLIRGLDLYTVLARPNGQRTWDSADVQACLDAFGYEKQPPEPIDSKGPEKAENGFVPIEAILAPIATVNVPVTEKPCEDCGEIGRHTSRHNSRLVCHACLCRESNIRSVAPPKPEKCWECGAEAQPTWDGRWLCGTHFSAAASAQASAADEIRYRRSVLNNEGIDRNTCDLAAQRGMDKSNDYARSVQIWEQQAREDSDRREQDQRERAALEEHVNRQRAEYISRHGMLPPDKF